MKNSRRPKGDGSITKLPNGNLLTVGADGKYRKDNKAMD